MPLHFQVFITFSTLANTNRQLDSIAIKSTKAACTTLPFKPDTANNKTISHIFHTMQEAEQYITHVQSVYSHSTPPPMVINGGQLSLFTEASQ
jgi:hypothetical protein